MTTINSNGHEGANPAQPLPPQARANLDAEIALAGGEAVPLAADGKVGCTMFDTPASTDNTVTVLLPYDHLHRLPSQSTVRIESHEDGHTYLGVVVAGPFAEPDGLRGDTPLMVTTTVRGALFIPRYHGRVQVEIVGERTERGALVPPRFRPRPNSPVFPLTSEETAAVLGTGGAVRLGVAAGHDEIEIAVPADSKQVFPRHTAVLGTTGGGKSNTVAGMIARLQAAGAAVIVLDTEGEYTRINEPAADARMLEALSRAGVPPAGVLNTTVYHLVGRETANPSHPNLQQFSLQYSELSPYMVVDILELPEAQEQRYFRAYDACKRLLYDLKIYPSNDQEKAEALELDDTERGYPRMTLAHVYDVIRYVERTLQGAGVESPLSPDFRGADELFKRVFPPSEKGKIGETHPTSWRALLGQIGKLRRLKIFDQPSVKPLPYQQLLRPGSVSIIDLSDTDSPRVNNLVIAELLRGVQERQEEAARIAEKEGRAPSPVVIFIEEAHEFLSGSRATKMEHVFEQVARIARRGRKRWLGLVFVTQLPQHLPDEVFGLVNNYVLHKISDAGVVTRLRRTVAGIDESLWSRLSGLAPGQAIVSFGSLRRAVLVAVDPAPCRLRMTD